MQPGVEDLHPNVAMLFPVWALKQYLHVCLLWRAREGFCVV